MNRKIETTTSTTTTHYLWNSKENAWVPDRKVSDTETVVSVTSETD